MPLIKPFPGLRPAQGMADQVVAPPYDVMTETEARRMVEGRPWSFVHISRPEVDLPLGTSAYAPEVYAKAADNLRAMIDQAVLQQDPMPCYYVYRMTMGEHVQTGLVAAASVTAYDQGRIKKHEFTRPNKEDDRVHQIQALKAQTGPVLLACPSDPAVDRLLAEAADTPAEIDVLAADQVRHQLWPLSTPAVLSRLSQLFDAMPALYVADGHHRSAAASRVAAARSVENDGHTGDDAYNYFLAAIFPHEQMRIMDYNRVVKDLNGLDRATFLRRIADAFSLEACDSPVKPSGQTEFGLYLPGQWYRLRLDARYLGANDPVQALDISLLSTHLIEPILAISDPRRDERIDFIGGIRGLQALEALVDSGEMAVAFALFPTSMEALMAVADSGRVMPPKSTWFEPKLADGLVSHLI